MAAVPFPFPWLWSLAAAMHSTMRRYDYVRLSPDEFRAALVALGWPDGSRFSEVTGANPATVQRWLKGGDGNDIPPWVRPFLALLNLPGGRKVATDCFDLYARPSEAERDNRKLLAERHAGQPRSGGRSDA